jgi:MFS family permease
MTLARLPATWLVAVVCCAQVLVQLGAYTWPALLPSYIDAWSLDYAEAGWITGAFYLAYVFAVPVLVTLTDRIDARRVYLFGATLTALAHLGFALFADGFWSAIALRALAGVGWAGAYMTGLKLLSDRVDERQMSRAVTGHAAGVGVAGALSFGFAGSVATILGAAGAFALAAASAGAAVLVTLVLVAPQQPQPIHRSGTRPKLFDFGPVLRNRSAMAYASAYCVHTWEMSALRGWAVAFLVWVAATTQSTASEWIAPTTVATLMGLVGTAASVAGNEWSIRFGRQRLIRTAMLIGMLCALLIVWLGVQSYWLAVVAVIGYASVIWLDSSSLTAGAAGSAEPARRGATLALHSMLGYAGGFIGPIVLGTVLHLSGGPSALAWGLAFAHLAIIGFVGRLVFTRLGPAALAGDRPS